MSPPPIITPDNSGLIVEESGAGSLRVRTSPLGTGLRNFAIAAYGVLMGWVLWSAGSKIVTLMQGGNNAATKGQTAATAHGTADEWFSIFVGFGLSIVIVSAICWGLLWLACSYQRLHVQGGILDYESRLGPYRLRHRRALLAEITSISIAEVGAQANDDIQATALVITTAHWKVNFGVNATFPALQQILDELQRMKAEASATK